MRARFVGDTERYDQLKISEIYEIDFRNEGILIFVSVMKKNKTEIGTFVFNDFQIFIDSWDFEGVKKPNRTIRKFTDFETTKWFTAGEAAQYFGIHKETLNRWVKQGKLPISHRVPPRGDRRFAREECVKLYETMMGGYGE